MTACKFDYDWSEKNIEDVDDEEKLLRAFFSGDCNDKARPVWKTV